MAWCHRQVADARCTLRPVPTGIRSPAYTKADANFTYARRIFGRSVTFSLAVQNLTNADYYASFSALSEPRSATASVMTRF